MIVGWRRGVGGFVVAERLMVAKRWRWRCYYVVAVVVVVVKMVLLLRSGAVGVALVGGAVGMALVMCSWR